MKTSKIACTERGIAANIKAGMQVECLNEPIPKGTLKMHLGMYWRKVQAVKREYGIRTAKPMIWVQESGGLRAWFVPVEARIVVA